VRLGNAVFVSAGWDDEHMFEPVGGPSTWADDCHAAALARLRAVLPKTPARIAEGPMQRAKRVSPGVFEVPRRLPRGAAVEPADELPPPSTDDLSGVLGPEVAALCRVDPAGLSSFDLLEAMAGWERLISRAQARQLDVLAEFARRRPGPYAPDEPSRRVSEFAGDEIAARLRLTRRAADIRLALALDLADRLPATRQAFLDGHINLVKARAMAEHTAGLADAPARCAVEERVLRRAASQTVSEMRRGLLRAVTAVDPAATTRRHAKAEAGRFLDMHPLPDGMAEINAVLPADDAMVVFTAADALARSADPKDPRGVEARRADALVDMCRAVLAGGATTPRADAEPSPADEPTTAKAANRSTRRRLVRRQRRRGPHIQVTVAATTLLGVDDQPGELAGYGSIPADVARRIAYDSDATWRRLLTDPCSGVLLDYGTTVYRPPPGLDRHVVARDQVCAFPGCRQPAIACDLDHRVPFPHGPTSEDNLGPLCRHHHRARHEAGWGWHRNADGSVTWTAPTGHQYPAPTPPVLGSIDPAATAGAGEASATNGPMADTGEPIPF
jgi:hypothetical protein